MALPMMTQTELVGELVDRTGWNRADAKRFLSELDEIVSDNLAQCVRTKVAGVVIEPKLRKASKKRQGRNPQTGEAVTIAAKPASVRVAARVTKGLKDKAPSVKKLQKNL